VTARWSGKGALIGAGAGITLIILLILQSFIGSGLLSTKTVTSTTTITATSTVPDAYDRVASIYLDYVSMLNTGNVIALAGEYESNATVEFAGVGPPGLVGNYTGPHNIMELLDVFLTRLATGFFVSNETHTIGPDGSIWVVNSTFHFGGNSTISGVVYGTIAAEYSYAYVNSNWLIARQTWNFTEYNEQYPLST
jgi:hypothetical protein